MTDYTEYYRITNQVLLLRKPFLIMPAIKLSLYLYSVFAEVFKGYNLYLVAQEIDLKRVRFHFPIQFLGNCSTFRKVIRLVARFCFSILHWNSWGWLVSSLVKNCHRTSFVRVTLAFVCHAKTWLQKSQQFTGAKILQ